MSTDDNVARPDGDGDEPVRLPVTAFSALVGQSLRCHDVPGGSGVLMELVEVRDLGTRATEIGPLACYALLLRHNGAKGAVRQGMLRMQHGALGVLDVFAVPVGPDGRGMCYEVIFN